MIDERDIGVFRFFAKCSAVELFSTAVVYVMVDRIVPRGTV